MTGWSSRQLQRGFDRTVVGFDSRARVDPLRVDSLGIVVGRSIQLGGERWVPSTIDSEVWSRTAGEDLLKETNGLNLFPSTQLVGKAAHGNDVALIAFDLPRHLVEEIATTFGLNQSAQFSPDEWEFLGFDIVDPRTQSSALYSFEWSRDEMIKHVSALNYSLNGFGLVSDEEQAIRFAIASDKEVPEHAPFAPCGVWRKRN